MNNREHLRDWVQLDPTDFLDEALGVLLLELPSSLLKAAVPPVVGKDVFFGSVGLRSSREQQPKIRNRYNASRMYLGKRCYITLRKM